MVENHDAVLHEIDRVILTMKLGYYLWFIIYALIVMSSVGLPAVAAVVADPLNRYFAGGAALAAAVGHALKPHAYATGFDAARKLAWKTRVSLVAGAIDPRAASENIRRAIDLTMFKYGPVQNPN